MKMATNSLHLFLYSFHVQNIFLPANTLQLQLITEVFFPSCLISFQIITFNWGDGDYYTSTHFPVFLSSWTMIHKISICL